MLYGMNRFLLKYPSISCALIEKLIVHANVATYDLEASQRKAKYNSTTIIFLQFFTYTFLYAQCGFYRVLILWRLYATNMFIRRLRNWQSWTSRSYPPVKKNVFIRHSMTQGYNQQLISSVYICTWNHILNPCSTEPWQILQSKSIEKSPQMEPDLKLNSCVSPIITIEKRRAHK